jgi:hypothetical protein
MKKIKFWERNTDKRRIHQGWLVKDMESKFIVKCGDYLIEYHYPHATYEYKEMEEE